MSKPTEGPYVISTLTDADDMEADLFEEDTIGIYAKSDLDNADECSAALCYMNSNWGEFRDTAALFTAAPDMLAVLQKVVSHGYLKDDALWRECRAAIAKATSA